MPDTYAPIDEQLKRMAIVDGLSKINAALLGFGGIEYWNYAICTSPKFERMLQSPTTFDIISLAYVAAFDVFVALEVGFNIREGMDKIRSAYGKPLLMDP